MRVRDFAAGRFINNVESIDRRAGLRADARQRDVNSFTPET